jgi:hypothetical protein
VRARLDASKFIDCKKEKDASLPPIDGLYLPPPIEPDAYLWAAAEPEEGTEEFQAGPVALEAAVVANAAAAMEPHRAPVRARAWGSCAIVGNSGMLRLTEFGKSIDSHDTVLRVNQAPTHGYSRRVGTKVTHRIFNRLWTRAYYSSQSKKKVCLCAPKPPTRACVPWYTYTVYIHRSADTWHGVRIGVGTTAAALAPLSPVSGRLYELGLWVRVSLG